MATAASAPPLVGTQGSYHGQSASSSSTSPFVPRETQLRESRSAAEGGLQLARLHEDDLPNQRATIEAFFNHAKAQASQAKAQADQMQEQLMAKPEEEKQLLLQGLKEQFRIFIDEMGELRTDVQDKDGVVKKEALPLFTAEQKGFIEKSIENRIERARQIIYGEVPLFPQEQLDVMNELLKYENFPKYFLQVTDAEESPLGQQSVAVGSYGRLIGGMQGQPYTSLEQELELDEYGLRKDRFDKRQAFDRENEGLSVQQKLAKIRDLSQDEYDILFKDVDLPLLPTPIVVIESFLDIAQIVLLLMASGTWQPDKFAEGAAEGGGQFKDIFTEGIANVYPNSKEFGNWMAPIGSFLFAVYDLYEDINAWRNKDKVVDLGPRAEKGCVVELVEKLSGGYLGGISKEVLPKIAGVFFQLQAVYAMHCEDKEDAILYGLLLTNAFISMFTAGKKGVWRASIRELQDKVTHPHTSIIHISITSLTIRDTETIAEWGAFTVLGGGSAAVFMTAFWLLPWLANAGYFGVAKMAHWDIPDSVERSMSHSCWPPYHFNATQSMGSG